MHWMFQSEAQDCVINEQLVIWCFQHLGAVAILGGFISVFLYYFIVIWMYHIICYSKGCKACSEANYHLKRVAWLVLFTQNTFLTNAGRRQERWKKKCNQTSFDIAKCLVKKQWAKTSLQHSYIEKQQENTFWINSPSIH